MKAYEERYGNEREKHSKANEEPFDRGRIARIPPEERVVKQRERLVQPPSPPVIFADYHGEDQVHNNKEHHLESDNRNKPLLLVIVIVAVTPSFHCPDAEIRDQYSVQ